MRNARTETFAHTMTGLLAKRQELVDEMATLRERQAVLSNDVEAIDRVLETLGYEGDIKLTPRVPRIVLFYRGELRQYLLGKLREAPQTSRELALGLVAMEGKDGKDRRLVNDVVRRIGKALRQMQDGGLVTRERKAGEFVWCVAT